MIGQNIHIISTCFLKCVGDFCHMIAMTSTVTCPNKIEHNTDKGTGMGWKALVSLLTYFGYAENLNLKV